MEDVSKEAPVNRLPNAALPVVVAAILAIVSPCPAQDPAAVGNQPAAQPPLDDTDLTLSISAGYQFLFRTDVDMGGSYTVDRVGLELKGKPTTLRYYVAFFRAAHGPRVPRARR